MAQAESARDSAVAIVGFDADYNSLTGKPDLADVREATFTDVAYAVFEATIDSADAALDLANGNVQDITFNEDVTLTITGATAGEMSELMLTMIGGYEVTLPNSISWLTNGGHPPVLTGNDMIFLFTKDGGSSWLARYLGAF